MWDEHRVSQAYSSTVSVLDHRVGRLDFDYAMMVGSQSRQRLHSLHPVPGTLTQRRLVQLMKPLCEGDNHVLTVRG